MIMVFLLHDNNGLCLDLDYKGKEFSALENA